jgi:flagella basal body P-ring formation protein FlgA
MRLLLALLLTSRVFAASSPEASLTKAVKAALGHPATVEVRSLSLNRPWPKGMEARLLNPERPFGLVAFEAGGTTGTAEVRVMAKVLVARVAIRDGEPFTTDNTAFEERELSRIGLGGYHTELTTLSALRARGRLQAGSVITTSRTQSPVLIQPGQTVELSVDRNGLQVKARVEALQRGRDQEWIRVRNPSTRKVLQAKVVGEGAVSL